MISRYTRPAMAAIWTDERRYRAWFDIEVLAAEAMVRRRKVPASAIKHLRENFNLNVDRILEIEKTVKHDVIAFLTFLEETAGPQARFLHMGLTSSDVVDTALAVQ